ncbi:MAG: HAD-IIB family hydrolase [Eubacteriales bacterium]|nr:HAD-IIB family hydrolase [Eubacteriales bacterium]
MIRLVASDIDGTLLQNGGRQIPEGVFGQIRRLKEKGILFAAASGRQYKSLRELFLPVADQIVYLCENGAILYREGKVLSKRPMPRKRAEELIRDIQAHDNMEVLISGANTSYLMPKRQDYEDHIRYFVGNNTTIVENTGQIREDILKVSAYCYDGAAKYDSSFGDAWRVWFQGALAGERWLDFMTADKGTGMEDLCRALRIAPEDAAAFGDNFNDLPMLRLVGSSWIIEGSALDRAGYGGQAGFLRTGTVEDILKKL